MGMRAIETRGRPKLIVRIMAVIFICVLLVVESGEKSESELVCCL